MEYAGILADRVVKRTNKSKLTATAVEVRAINWLFKVLTEGGDKAVSAAGFRLQWSNKCVRCGRKLTTPSSIDGRVGPECAKSLGLR